MTDEDLLTRVAGGDPEALRVLYGRHAPTMMRMLGRMTRDQQVAEEILQDTWMAVWRSAGSFRADASGRAWTLGVCRRQAHNHLRRPAPAMPVDPELAAPVVDPGPSVEEQVLSAAGVDAVAGALDELPEHLAETVALVFVDELSYPEAAEVLDVPVGTVKSRVSHARRRLAVVLRPRLQGDVATTARDAAATAQVQPKGAGA